MNIIRYTVLVLASVVFVPIGLFVLAVEQVRHKKTPK